MSMEYLQTVIIITDSDKHYFMLCNIQTFNILMSSNTNIYCIYVVGRTWKILQ